MTRRRNGGRRARRRERSVPPLASIPFQPLQNLYSPLEILVANQVEGIHEASMHILEEIGLEFLDEETLGIWKSAGALVNKESQRVRIDGNMVEEALKTVPSSFTLRARNPDRNVTIGGNSINFATVANTPYYSDLKSGRQPGSLEKFEKMLRLAHVCGPIHVIEGMLLEPQDIPIPQRHLAKGYAVYSLSDKAHLVASHGREIAEDHVNMASIVFGGEDEIKCDPVLSAVVNANSPLRYDERMLGGLLTYARYRQPVAITPFILAGAMSPVSLPSALAQQNAEALAGITLTQLVNPGTPVIYGGFATSIDMQTGSPAFGGPEGALALLAGAQLARFYGLPYRGSGGLNNSKTVDAQAAYESQMTLWPAVLGHTNLIIHSAGWLESGLVCSLEKFVLDVEGLAMMCRFLNGLEINEESLALEEIAEVGPGGNHFGTAYTMARFQDAFYRPTVSDRQNYESWIENGEKDALHRAHETANQLLEIYEQPVLPSKVQGELMEYVEMRKKESTVTYF
ncbi:MAG: trimethylamine methyltransferase family protein [Anaerolineales bacterium]|jgi:trimethylamine--corrinoid protein Co-methyltransferase